MNKVMRYGRPYPPMTDRASGGPCCKAASRDAWLCTRPDGHEGRHEAGNAAGQMFASWEDEPARLDYTRISDDLYRNGTDGPWPGKPVPVIHVPPPDAGSAS